MNLTIFRTSNSKSVWKRLLSVSFPLFFNNNQQCVVIIIGEEERHWQKNFVRTLDRSSSEIYRYDE